MGDIEEALTFYGRLFRFELLGKSDSMAFIDLGDQFIALQKGRRQAAQRFVFQLRQIRRPNDALDYSLTS